MTSVCTRIKEKYVHNALAVTAHRIEISHAVEGIQHGTKSIIDNSGTWLDRIKASMLRLHPSCICNALSEDKVHLGKLKGQFVSLDACNTATKLGNNSCKKIDEVSEEKQITPLMIDSVEVATSLEPCEHHQRNVCIHGSSKEVTKSMQIIIERNSINAGNDGL